MAQAPKKTVKKTQKPKKAKAKKQSWIAGIVRGKKGRPSAVIFIVGFAVIGVVTLALTYAATTSAEGQIKLGAGALCLNNEHGEQEKGNPVKLRPCTKGSQQQWKVDGKHYVLDGDEGKFCFAVRRAGTGTKWQVHGHVWTCDSGAPQLWEARSDGTILNTPTGLCLQAESATSGAGVVVATCNGTALQQWTVPAKKTPTPSHTITDQMKKTFTQYINAHYPGWTIASMKYDPMCDGSEAFDVAITNAQKQHKSVILDRNGTFLQTEIDVAYTKAPKTLLNILKANYSKYTYGSTYEQITTAGGESRYLVDLNSGSKSSELILSTTGAVVCQTKFE